MKQWVFVSSGEGNCAFFKETQNWTWQKEGKPDWCLCLSLDTERLVKVEGKHRQWSMTGKKVGVGGRVVSYSYNWKISLKSWLFMCREGTKPEDNVVELFMSYWRIVPFFVSAEWSPKEIWEFASWRSPLPLITEEIWHMWLSTSFHFYFQTFPSLF